MKKILTLVLAMALVFSVMGTTTVLAAETNTVDTYSINSTRTLTGTMVGGTTVFEEQMLNIGINPRFTFKIEGNPQLYVDVVLTDPNGNVFTAFSNICCNGTTYGMNYTCNKQGRYFVTIRVNHGVSAGQRKDYTVTATW